MSRLGQISLYRRASSATPGPRRESRAYCDRFRIGQGIRYPPPNIHARSESQSGCLPRNKLWTTSFALSPIRADQTRSSRCGTALPRSCSARDTTRPPLTCGLSDASLRRWPCDSRSSPATLRLTRFSGSSGEWADSTIRRDLPLSYPSGPGIIGIVQPNANFRYLLNCRSRAPLLTPRPACSVPPTKTCGPVSALCQTTKRPSPNGTPSTSRELSRGWTTMV